MKNRTVGDNKLAILQLQEALDYSENIVSTIREPLVVLDGKLRIITANASFYHTFSVVKQDTEGKLIYEVGNGQWNIAKLRELLEDILPKNSSFENYEVDHKFPGLGQRIMLLNARRIHDGDSKTQKILLAIEDITERKTIENKLSFSELRYRRLFETAYDGILILDAQTGAINDVNPFLVKMLGYSKEELQGKKLWEIGFFKDESASRNAFQILQDKGYIRYEDLPLETKEGKSIDVEFVSNVYPIDGEKVVQCNIRDITDRKKAQEQVKKLNKTLTARAKELELANKELEGYSFTISTNVQSPLRHIVGFSQALLEDYSDKLDEQGKNYLQRISKASKLSSKILDNLIELSSVKIGELNKDTVDLSRIALSIIEKRKDAYQKRNIEFQIQPDISVAGDYRLLTRVMENLLDNSLKFTEKVRNPRIEFGITRIGKKKAYFVKDNGVGFDMAYSKNLFTPFVQLHSNAEYPGAGIGLSVAQAIIRRCGGNIWADSKVGGDTTFYFTLR